MCIREGIAMREIRTQDAVGHILCHDITQIVKDEKKGVLFKKGHVVRQEDIPALWMWEKSICLSGKRQRECFTKMRRLGLSTRNLCGREYARHRGERRKNRAGRGSGRSSKDQPQSAGGCKFPGRDDDRLPPWGFCGKKGDKLAGTRIIPLVIQEEKMKAARAAAGAEPVFRILPFHHKKVGIVTTGSEVQKGRIKDTFTPVLQEKLAEFPTEVIGQTTPEMTGNRSQMIFFAS